MHSRHSWHRVLSLVFCLCLAPLHGEEPPAYGTNDAAGNHARVNGTTLYYETYGEGEPLLLIHPNSGSIANMAGQISEFSKHYRVIAVDSRGHGKSGLDTEHLTYPLMAADFAALLEQLKLRRVKLVGWSDGGIIGLLLAIKNPDRVGKMAIMGTNLNPAGLCDWSLPWFEKNVREIQARLAENPGNAGLLLTLQRIDLCVSQPDIPAKDLGQVRSPVLVMAADRDMIRTAHTVEIFEHLPKSQLLIFPGATHMLPTEDPGRFNAAVSRFLSTPFSMPDTKALTR